MANGSKKLDLAKQRYRIMKGDEIIGQFSNRELAGKTADQYHAIVLDMSVIPAKVVYQAGKWLEMPKGGKV
jgi:predicted component of type VI protein secretion system